MTSLATTAGYTTAKFVLAYPLYYFLAADVINTFYGQVQAYRTGSTGAKVIEGNPLLRAFGTNRYSFLAGFVLLAAFYSVALFLTPEDWSGIILVTVLVVIGCILHMYASQTWCLFNKDCGFFFRDVKRYPETFLYVLMVVMILVMLACVIAWAVLKGLRDKAQTDEQKRKLFLVSRYVSLALTGFVLLVIVFAALITIS